MLKIFELWVEFVSASEKGQSLYKGQKGPLPICPLFGSSTVVILIPSKVKFLLNTNFVYLMTGATQQVISPLTAKILLAKGARVMLHHNYMKLVTLIERRWIEDSGYIAQSRLGH